MPRGIKTELSEEEKLLINNLYFKENNSIRELRKKFKISEKKIYDIIGVARNIKEANKIGCAKRPKIISMEQKKKISESMKKLHSEGKHPGWMHINSSKDRRSFPEKVFLDQLNKYKLNEKYTFFEKMPFGKYFLDFALIDLKVDIEIDGQQHYRNDENINHDKMRDEFVKNKGWRVYRISFKEMRENLQKVMEELQLWLLDIDDNSDRYYQIEEVKIIPCKIKKQPRKLKFNITKNELEKLIKEKSICEIARFYNVTDNAIRKRCKKYCIQIEKYYWQKNLLNKTHSSNE